MLTELRNREIAEAEGLAVEQLPAHQAAARRRSEDKALGRSETTASERRAAARAEVVESATDEAEATVDQDESTADEDGDDGTAADGGADTEEKS
jgi:hypothetical protein